MSRRQRQFEHAISIRVPDFTIRNRKAQWIVAPPSRAHDYLANPIHRIGVPVRILCREALVRMFVPRQDQGSVRRVKVLPELLQFGMNGVAFKHAAAE